MLRCPNCNEPLELRRHTNGGKHNATPVDEVIALHRFGATNTEIANLYDITPQRVSAIVRKHTKT